MKAEEKEIKEKYNIAAEYYHDLRTKTYPTGWFYNEMLEMPATFELMNNIKGKRILDFGCGTGIYSKKMTEMGAKVKGFDISQEMLKIAKRENPKLELRLGSGYKIPFNEKFDIVVAPLVLEHLEDWDRVFKQIKRVLKKEGHFIFSTDNPVVEVTTKTRKKEIMVRKFENYFAERKNYSHWGNIINKKEIKDLMMPSYHKTYESIIKIILDNNFEIVGYKDCFPLRKAKKYFPEKYSFASQIPTFCVWKVKLK